MKRLIKPARTRRLEIRCTVADGIVGNIPVTCVFFFERRLDPNALADALEQALAVHPM